MRVAGSAIFVSERHYINLCYVRAILGSDGALCIALSHGRTIRFWYIVCVPARSVLACARAVHDSPDEFKSFRDSPRPLKTHSIR